MTGKSRFFPLTLALGVSLGTAGVQAQKPIPPHTLHSLGKPAPLPTMLSVSMWHKVRFLHPGMTPEQATEARPFVPMVPRSGKHGNWCTLEYDGPLTPGERKELNGKMIAVDVQVVMHPGPVSASNPANGSINPTMSGETIATISAPYLSDGGAIQLD